MWKINVPFNNNFLWIRNDKMLQKYVNSRLRHRKKNR